VYVLFNKEADTTR